MLIFLGALETLYSGSPYFFFLTVIPDNLLSFRGGDKLDKFDRGVHPRGGARGLGQGVVGVHQDFVALE